MNQVLRLLVFGIAISATLARYMPVDGDDDKPLADIVYDLCEKHPSNCFGHIAWDDPNGQDCFSNKSCTIVIAYEKEKEKDAVEYTFHAYGAYHYVALAWGQYFGMGDDPVVACMKDDKNAVTISKGKNVPNTSQNSSDATLNLFDDSTGLKNLTLKGDNEAIYCSFRINSVGVQFDDTELTLKNNTNGYVFFGAAGKITDGKPDDHEIYVGSDGKLFKREYDVCNEDLTNCFGKVTKDDENPKDCLKTQTCNMVIGYEKTNDDAYTFHAYSKATSYVGIAWGQEPGMGNDPLVVCIKGEENEVNISKAMIRTDPNFHVELIDDKSGLDEASLVGTADDESLSCSFKLSADSVKFDEKTTLTLKNNREGYFIIGAAGNVKDGLPSGHTIAVQSDEKVFLSTIYDVCDKDFTNCLGTDDENDKDCLKTQTCNLVIAYEKTDNDGPYTFHAFTKTNDYVAIAYAQQQGMGNDPSVICIKDADNNVTVSKAMNLIEPHKGIALIDDKTGLQEVNVPKDAESLYCAYQLSDKVAFNETSVVLKDNKEGYFFQGAAGPTKDGAPSRHSITIHSDEKIFKEGDAKGSATSTFAYTSLVLAGLLFSKLY